MEKTTPREWKLILLSSVIYFCVYFTRYNFAAAIAPMTEALSVSNSAVSFALTGCAITYGLGQVVCGFLGDKISPRYFIAFGLFGCFLCNFLVYLLSSIAAIVIVWTVSGLFQAMIWPSLSRALTENMTMQTYKRRVVMLNYACSLSTFTIYFLLVPLCLRFFSWRAAFLIPALLAVLCMLAWFFLLPRLTVKKEGKEVSKENDTASAPVSALPKGALWHAVCQAGLPFVCVCIFLVGFLRDGIGDWMPTFIIETYHLEDASAIMTSAVLPAFSVLCVFITGQIYLRLKNEQKTDAVLWGTSLVGAVALLLFYTRLPAVGVIMLALLNGCMHGIGHILSTRIAPYFDKYHRVSTVSGCINACTYLGAAIAAPGCAFLSEALGWGAVLVTWSVIVLLGLIVTLVHLPRFTRFLKDENRR